MLFNKHKSAWQRGVLLLLAAVLVVTLAAACGKGKTEGGTAAPGGNDAKTVATYKNGGKVTETEFNKYVTLMEITDPQTAMYLSIPQFKEQELQRYIVYKEFSKQATDEEKKAAKEEADKFKGELDKALGADTGKDLKDKMAESKLTSEESATFAEMMIAAGKVIEKKSKELEGTIKDEDVKAEFNKAPADYNTVTLRHVLVATSDSATGKELRTEAEALKRAQEVKKKLDAGGDWTKLAKEYSDDPGSKDNGGAYAPTQAKKWVAAFKEAANTQKIGVIGEPVLTEFGYHVMKVEKRDVATFDTITAETKTELKQTLLAPKLNEFMQAEQDKLAIKTNIPQETPQTGDGTTSGGATDKSATDNGGQNEGTTAK
ncbi:peptidylprolyl isomerase [Paenibacillus darwinianus]|uniref:Peptidylprolyl isomerase n=1 Tax=Paenibacillus darwinianus TaxID=1380763 RepID=A0A9W5W6B7_9BACL|nr:peptidylprolyl isomerase [Paenibacillus darwinianus]EXX86327.1 peptidylprolyl isomerase [Paenibacillus darwinianus]EXX86429.1 peptidylprolyl isomerase [Paenibacillus darwinianus]EXX88554.1 peptidylprolyl isomerase [Paenibacillus darwinianus]